jgi:ElaB/YqjD/DUF883 family membrane-anchored ribosome-binding protein
MSAKRGEDMSDSWEEALGELRKDFDKRFEEIRVRLDEKLDEGRNVVRERPLVSLGAAVAIGIIIGVLLGRKSKE